MQWKFRKEFQVMPGVKLQYGKNGIRTEFTTPPDLENHNFEAEKLKHELFKPYDPIHEIKSASIGTLSSESLKSFKSLLVASDLAFEETKKLLDSKNDELAILTKRSERLERNLFKFLFKKKLERLQAQGSVLAEEVTELTEQLSLSTVSLTIESEGEFSELYRNLSKAFELLTRSKKKWDFTSSKRNNMVAERTSASESVTRSEIAITSKSLPILKCTEPALCFHNMNGGDLYFYPGFLIVYESKNRFDLISYVDINIVFKGQRFIESEGVPADAQVVGHTWSKVNKDGSPDRRFSGNYQIPIALYGQIELVTQSGLKEVYCFSNLEYTEMFSKALNNYISALKVSSSMLKEHE